MTTTLVNGIEVDQISVHDRAVQYGDGLFETIAIRNGEPEYWQLHMDRLLAGCDRLFINRPDTDSLLRQSLALSQQQAAAVLKIIVSRGEGGRGFRIHQDMPATTIVSISAWPEYPAQYYTEGVTIRSCDTLLSQQPRLAGIKHLNRLEQILARAEWSDEGIAEGLLCDNRGHLIEGTFSNLFLLQDGVIVTPDLTNCGVAGIMRQLVLDACDSAAVNYRIESLNTVQAKASDEIFLTNSLLGVWPVRQWDDKTYRVNGEILTRLIKHINKKR